jgi:hypothetical protein
VSRNTPHSKNRLNGNGNAGENRETIRHQLQKFIQKRNQRRNQPDTHRDANRIDKPEQHNRNQRALSGIGW